MPQLRTGNVIQVAERFSYSVIDGSGGAGTAFQAGGSQDSSGAGARRLKVLEGSGEVAHYTVIVVNATDVPGPATLGGDCSNPRSPVGCEFAV